MAGFDETLEAELMDITGGVPLYLSDFRKLFLSIPADTPFRTQSALAKFSVALGELVSYAFDNFQSQATRDRIEPDMLLTAWEHLIRGEAANPKHFDHAFFFCPKDNPGRSGSVSTIASSLLAQRVVELRKKLLKKLDYASLLLRCRQADNPSVQGFLAEQLVLTSISCAGIQCDTDYDCGLDISAPDGSDGDVYFHLPESLPLKNPDEPSILHYIPNAYNYKHIDSLLRQVVATEKGSFGKGAAKRSIYGPPALLRVVAFQPTLQPLSAHNYSLDFYNSGDYKKWEPSAFDEIERHFVWVLRTAEYKAVVQSIFFMLFSLDLIISPLRFVQIISFIFTIFFSRYVFVSEQEQISTPSQNSGQQRAFF